MWKKQKHHISTSHTIVEIVQEITQIQKILSVVLHLTLLRKAAAVQQHSHEFKHMVKCIPALVP